MKYIIEHMDPELWEWSVLEYKHVSQHVGKDNLIVTHVMQEDEDKLGGCCEVEMQSVAELGLRRVCVLDPDAEKTLEPSDASEFDYLVFGGILGDHPAKARTKELQVPGAKRRNLGKEQLATDNAVMVAKMIVEDGKKLSDLEFSKDFVVPMDEGEEIILPFTYVMVDGKVFISDEIVEHVKEHGF
jgi:ribosome biogenesis SPOUT family RNA methylase Rps3